MFAEGEELKGDLSELFSLYTYFQSSSICWPHSLQKIETVVKDMLNQEDYDFEVVDLMAIWSFLFNLHRLGNFLHSEYYVKNQHATCLIQLFKLSYKMACKFAYSEEEEALLQYKRLINELERNIDFTMASTNCFVSYVNVVCGIINRNIEWPD